MTETQERFLRTVLTRVPLDSVVELHLFPPIRRGTLETGVAVIATVLPPAPLAVMTASEPDTLASATSASDTLDAEPVAMEHVEHVEPEALEPTRADDPDAESGRAVPDDAAATAVLAAGFDDSPYAAEPPPAEATRADDASDVGDGEAPDAPIATPAPRLRILTAAYRHTVKGVERGKWIVDVQEEADAPLDAVEAVLRGVRHRSTEPADPELVSHDALAALLTPSAVAPAA